MADPSQPIPGDFVMPPHAEVHPLDELGSIPEMFGPTVNANDPPRSVNSSVPVHGVVLGERGGGVRQQHGVRRAGGDHSTDQPSEEDNGEDFAETSSFDRQEEPTLTTSGAAGFISDGSRVGIEGGHGGYARANATDAGAHAEDEFGQVSRGVEGARQDVRGSRDPGGQFGAAAQGEEGQQACSSDRIGGAFSVEQPFLRRPDLQHHAQPAVPDNHFQIEANIAAAAGEAGGRNIRSSAQVASQPSMDSGDAWPLSGEPLGSSRSCPATMLQSQALPSGTAGRRDRGDLYADDVGEEGGTSSAPEVTDPNAPTTREQVRRAIDRAEVVKASETGLPPGQADDAARALRLGHPERPGDLSEECL